MTQTQKMHEMWSEYPYNADFQFVLHKIVMNNKNDENWKGRFLFSKRGKYRKEKKTSFKLA